MAWPLTAWQPPFSDGESYRQGGDRTRWDTSVWRGRYWLGHLRRAGPGGAAEPRVVGETRLRLARHVQSARYRLGCGDMTGRTGWVGQGQAPVG